MSTQMNEDSSKGRSEGQKGSVELSLSVPLQPPMLSMVLTNLSCCVQDIQVGRFIIDAYPDLISIL